MWCVRASTEKAVPTTSGAAPSTSTGSSESGSSYGTTSRSEDDVPRVQDPNSLLRASLVPSVGGGGQAWLDLADPSLHRGPRRDARGDRVSKLRRSRHDHV